MKKQILFLFILLSSYFVKAQVVQLSVYSEISIVTAGPGNELYEAFGHSAIRIKDPVLRLDIVYNYGMFDFDAPNFYSNFTKGKLIYKLGRYPFDIFLRSYSRDNRWVKQQVLNLTQQQRQAFFIYLEKNVLPQNASYLYDPFYNNCASKLKDITKDILGNNVVYSDDHSKENLSLRKLMNNEIPWNTWGSFGINLALGNKLDKTATAEEYLYLPDYVYSVFKNSYINENGTKKELVKKEEIILDYPELKQEISFLNPLLVFIAIALIGFIITIIDVVKKRRTKLLDFLLFFITGLIGIVIAFLWFFTDHSTTPNNFNILWAFTPNLFIAFYLFASTLRIWLYNYLKLLLILLFVIPFFWISGFQKFPIAVIPLLILLTIRYLFLIKYFSSKIQ